MTEKIRILGVSIDNITLEEAGEISKELIEKSNKSCFLVVAPNTEFIMTAQKDKEFFDINSALLELSAQDFYDYCYNRKFSYNNKGFAQNIDIDKFKELIKNSTLKDLSYYFSAFKSIYNIINKKDFYQEDIESLLKIKESLNEITCNGQKLKAERLLYFVQYIEEVVIDLQQVS